MTEQTDPLRSYNFTVLIEGVTAGRFVECSGLDVKVHAIRYQEGGSHIARRIPGPVEYGDVTLRYGLTTSTELWNWFSNVVRGQVERRNVSILMLAPDDVTEALRWDLIAAWPSEWRAAPLDALSKEVAIESLTLVFETIERA